MGQAAVQRRRATYADLEAVPAHEVAELIRGTLHVMPRPAPKHAHAVSILNVELGPFQLGRRGPGGWRILFEPELHFPEPGVPGAIEAVVPDLAGWRLERLPALPETAYFALAPDWICEILSPSTAAFDREEKMPIYAREGVQHAWLVDPLARTLEVFALEDRTWARIGDHRGSARVRAAPFEAIDLDLAVLWEE